jgi:hypothetical protein
MSHLPFLLPWVRVNLLIRSITSQVCDERTWPIAKAHLSRALEIRRDLTRGAVVELDWRFRQFRRAQTLRKSPACRGAEQGDSE